MSLIGEFTTFRIQQFQLEVFQDDLVGGIRLEPQASSRESDIE